MPRMNDDDTTNAVPYHTNKKTSIPTIAMTANVHKEEVERCY